MQEGGPRLGCAHAMRESAAAAKRELAALQAQRRKLEVQHFPNKVDHLERHTRWYQCMNPLLEVTCVQLWDGCPQVMLHGGKAQDAIDMCTTHIVVIPPANCAMPRLSPADLLGILHREKGGTAGLTTLRKLLAAGEVHIVMQRCLFPPPCIPTLLSPVDMTAPSECCLVLGWSDCSCGFLCAAGWRRAWRPSGRQQKGRLCGVHRSCGILCL